MPQLTKEQLEKLNQQQKQPEQQQAKTPKSKRAKVSKSEALTTTKTVLSAPATLKENTIASVQAQMDNFAEDFSDEVVATVEDGLIHAIELTGQKVQALGVTDFFGGMVPSLSGSSAPTIAPSENGQTTIEVEAKTLETSVN